MARKDVVIEKGRILLTEATIMDAERTLEAIDQESSKALKRFADACVTIGNQREYLNRMWNSKSDKLYLIELRFRAPEEALVGSIGLHEIDWANGTARAGLMLFRPEHRGQGYGSEAIGLLHEVAFRQLGLHRLEANVVATNARNRKRFADLGYREEGVRREAYLRGGERHDMAHFSLLAHEWQG